MKIIKCNSCGSRYHAREQKALRKAEICPKCGNPQRASGSVDSSSYDRRGSRSTAGNLSLERRDKKERRGKDHKTMGHTLRRDMSQLMPDETSNSPAYSPGYNDLPDENAEQTSQQTTYAAPSTPYVPHAAQNSRHLADAYVYNDYKTPTKGARGKTQITIIAVVAAIVAVVIIIGIVAIMVLNNSSNDRDIIGVWTSEISSTRDEILFGGGTIYSFDSNGKCERVVIIGIGFSVTTLEYVGNYTAKDGLVTIEWESLTTISSGFATERSDREEIKTEPVNDPPKIHSYSIRGDILTIDDSTYYRARSR